MEIGREAATSIPIAFFIPLIIHCFFWENIFSLRNTQRKNCSVQIWGRGYVATTQRNHGNNNLALMRLNAVTYCTLSIHRSPHIQRSRIRIDQNHSTSYSTYYYQPSRFGLLDQRNMHFVGKWTTSVNGYYLRSVRLKFLTL